MKGLFIVAGHVGKGGAKCLFRVSIALFYEGICSILKQIHYLGVNLVKVLDCVSRGSFNHIFRLRNTDNLENDTSTLLDILD